MKLSTKTRYGTRVLLDLALYSDSEPTLLKDIARRQEFSLSYLEQLIAPLIAAGLVRSTRGPGGGIRLIKPSHEIRLNEVIQLYEGSMAPAECVDHPETCPRSGFCLTRDLWSRLKDSINGVLESTTLYDLVEQQKCKEQSVYVLYNI